MTTEADQRRNALLRNLRHALRSLEALAADDLSGRSDILIRIERVRQQMRGHGIGEAEFAQYCAEEDEREAIERDRGRELAYQRTGLIPQ